MADEQATTTVLSDRPPSYSDSRLAGRARIGVRAFVGTGATSVFIQACTVLQGVLLARLLGPTGRGELAAVILWPSVFAGIGSFGVDIALCRTAARGCDLGAITRAALLLAVCTAAVAAGVCYVLLPQLLPADKGHLLPIAHLFLLHIIINHVALNLIGIDQGAGNFRRFNVARMILYPAYVGLIVVLWALGWTRVSAFAAALLVASAAAAVYCLFHALRSFRLVGALFPPLRILRQGLQYGLARAVETLYLYADRALLLWLLDVRELGLYTAALAASGVINSLATGSGMVTFTIAARSEDRSGSERVSEIFRAVALVWLVLGGVLILMMPYAVPLVFGREYLSAVGPAILLIPGSALAGLFALLEQTLRGQGRAFLGVQGRLAGLAVMVPISYLGSILWEIRGVCLAFIVAQGISLVVLVVHTRRHYGQAFSIRSLVPTLDDARKMAQKITTQARIMLRRQD